MDIARAAQGVVRATPSGATYFTSREDHYYTPSISPDDRVKQGRSASHIHQQQREAEEAWLHHVLAGLSEERRHFTKQHEWREYLHSLYDGERAVPAWLYHHPEDIRAEQATYDKREWKNPWHKREEKIEFDEQIFTRARARISEPDRPVSPRGKRQVDLSDPPLPYGAQSWKDVQGLPSKGSGKKWLTRAAKGMTLRLFHTPPALYLRSIIGPFIDCRDIKWPDKYRLTKTKEQWTCQ